jgi:membrane carboxypeptidase/penicillin-binding protein PbpC
MDERVAYLITDILADNLARAPAFGEGSALRLSRPAAAKTGTTTDWRDNWTVGYTPDLVTGVWVGNADNAPMGQISGATGAAPIWHDVMEALLKGRPIHEFVEPPGMTRVEVCADSGLLPARPALHHEMSAATPSAGSRDTCQNTVQELFIAGTEPTRTDDWHWVYALDVRNGLLAGPGCAREFTTPRRYTLYPAEAEAWVRWQGIPQPPQTYSPLCPARRLAQSSAGEPGGVLPEEESAGAASSERWPLLITSPDQGSRFVLSGALPADAQRLLVAARPAEGVSVRQVTLLVDGLPLATFLRPPYQAAWILVPGRHAFAVTGVDASGGELAGNSVSVDIIEEE